MPSRPSPRNRAHIHPHSHTRTHTDSPPTQHFFSRSLSISLTPQPSPVWFVFSISHRIAEVAAPRVLPPPFFSCCSLASPRSSTLRLPVRSLHFTFTPGHSFFSFIFLFCTCPYLHLVRSLYSYFTIFILPPFLFRISLKACVRRRRRVCVCVSACGGVCVVARLRVAPSSSSLPPCRSCSAAFLSSRLFFFIADLRFAARCSPPLH